MSLILMKKIYKTLSNQIKAYLGRLYLYWFYYNFTMQLINSGLTPLRKGTNSQLFTIKTSATELVLKCVNETYSRQVGHLLNEHSIMKKVSHRNILEVYKCMSGVALPQKEGNFSILLQEYAAVGNLSDLIKNHAADLSYQERRFLFGEICQAIEYLHGINIVHRDIKLDNILVDEDLELDGLTLKVADFGFACSVTEGQLMAGYKGTKRGYMAPEIHQCRTSTSKKYCAKRTDVFALGVVLYAVVMGRLPFEHATPEDRHYKHICSNDIGEFWRCQESLIEKVSLQQDSLVQQFKDMFVRMVAFDPKERMKMEEVLQHGWLLGKKKQPEL